MNEREIIAKEWRDDNGILHRREVGQELVRCKACKYCVDAGAQKALVCDNSYIDMDIHPDDFCSYGERRE